MSMSVNEFYRPLPHIVLFGKRRAGKDEVAKLLFDMGFDTKRVAFGDPLRDKFHDTFPHIPREPKPVEHYQYYGQAMRHIDPDIWVMLTIGRLKLEKDLLERALLTPYSYIFTDVRQPNELEAAKKLGAIVVKVVATQEVRVSRMLALGEDVSMKTLEAPTELIMDSFPFDYVVVNNGTPEELKENVTELIYQIQKGRAAHGKEEKATQDYWTDN